MMPALLANPWHLTPPREKDIAGYQVNAVCAAVLAHKMGHFFAKIQKAVSPPGFAQQEESLNQKGRQPLKHPSFACAQRLLRNQFVVWYGRTYPA
jgi:hypothetical protein